MYPEEANRFPDQLVEQLMVLNGYRLLFSVSHKKLYAPVYYKNQLNTIRGRTRHEDFLFLIHPSFHNFLSYLRLSGV